MVRLIQEQGLEATGRFYSIYTGIVEDNDDPLQMHRLKVSVPSVMGGITQWAFAKGSPGGFNCGAKLLTPDIGDLVYVEFEFGNPDKPLWTYNGWGEDEMPQELADPDVMGVVTPNGNIITVNDKTGDLSIHLNGNTSIQLDGDFIVQSKDSVCIGGEKGTAINAISKHHGKRRCISIKPNNANIKTPTALNLPNEFDINTYNIIETKRQGRYHKTILY